MTSESRRCCNVNSRSENRRRKHKVATTLFFSCSNNVGNTTLTRYPTSRPKYNQNPKLLQRRVPAGIWFKFFTPLKLYGKLNSMERVCGRVSFNNFAGKSLIFSWENRGQFSRELFLNVLIKRSNWAHFLQSYSLQAANLLNSDSTID